MQLAYDAGFKVEKLDDEIPAEGAATILFKRLSRRAVYRYP